MKASLLVVIIGLSAVGASAAGPTLWRDPSTAMPFVKIPKGCFQMGSSVEIRPGNQALHEVGFQGSLSADEMPAHEVCLNDFWIGQYEVRAREWRAVMGAPPPEGEGEAPAAGLTAAEAAVFLTRLNERSAGAGGRFRLPTEAEWEYACHAGRPEPYRPKDPPPTDVAVFSHPGAPGTRLLAPARAGSRMPNAWNIYDMLGNVWEWTADTYRVDAYTQHALYGPRETRRASDQVIRGGSHRSEASHVRCASRSRYPADSALPSIGFRVLREGGA